MIITFTESDADSKSTPLLSDSTSIAQSSERLAEPSPPAYNPSPGPSVSAAPQMPLIRQPSGREPAWRRFLKAFLFAALIYLALVMAMHQIANVAKKNLFPTNPDGPYDTDGRVIRCTNDVLHLETEQSRQFPAVFPPTFPPYTTTISFGIPVSSSLIFLLSRGSYDAASSVKLELSDKPIDYIEIEVAIRYSSKAALKRAQVCLLERDEGGQGVGIFTPRRFPSKPRDPDRMKFVTTIRFPKSGSPENPLVINALETNMGIWSHQISSLENRVVFKSLSLHGSNAPIRVQSVFANAAQFKTSNSPITGSYNVSDTLVLTTSNAPITASIQLENHDGHNPTSLNVKTSNGRIITPITLLSTQRYVSDPAAFSADIKTSNAPLDISFPDAPLSPFSHLDLTGKTSNAAANVKLHATYEGSISLKTSSVFTAGLVQKPGTQDPSGRGRHRIVDVRRVVKSTIEAGVWWGDDPNKDEGKGKLVVQTSNSNNMVELG